MSPFRRVVYAARTQFFGTRPPVERAPATAAFTADVLGHLAVDHYTARAWWCFWIRSWARSVDAARARPRACWETQLLHALLFAGTRDPRVVISWLMTWTHLGLLPEAGGLGVPNLISLIRANLPILARDRPRFAATAAIMSDFADGIVARRIHRETAFGAYADGLADAVFWLWFAARFEPSRRWRQFAMVVWFAPPVAITTAAFAGGRLPAIPRPNVVRAASAALQLALTARALFRRRHQ